MTIEELLKKMPPELIHAVVKGFQAGMETRGDQVIELRLQVILLRGCLKNIESRFDYGPSYGSIEWMTLNDVVVALAATETTL